MSRNVLIGILLAASVAIGSWALAQQGLPAAKASSPADDGQFVVSPAGPSAVLVDARSGKTWVLTGSVSHENVWIPVRRIDAEKDVQEWQLREKELKKQMAEQERVGLRNQ